PSPCKQLSRSLSTTGGSDFLQTFGSPSFRVGCAYLSPTSVAFPRLFRLRLTSVSGFPLPWRTIRLPCSRLPVTSAESGVCRISQVPDASFHAYHALRWTPADPREPYPAGSSV